ncbi:MAG: hypothetical protein ACD_18C00164G0004 [uncultured bacterium]|nr:MAG: hypothetical protein ACD_18C00164G0004 [uncultured bacterium]OGH90030.1 MAG: hypothetical protein A2507_03505 [Candidatus Magasanikbacteria bacterium RIFOXYD12_FULL_33_17]HAO52144.1 hypothetical protein [Candidatus Magasanikbacteria bacterium]
MGEIINVDFGKGDINKQTSLEEQPATLFELYRQISATKLTPEIVSSFSELLKPFSFEELVDFMQQISSETVSERKSGFTKAVMQEIRRKQIKK